MNIQKTKPVLQALAAAILFGASTPLSKVLLTKVDPIGMAALLYLGTGLGLAILKGIGSRKTALLRAEARITRQDLPWLAGAVISGGILAPIVLMVSLEKTPAATASLLLNFEGIATALIAFVIFREAIGRSIWLAVAAITAGSILLSWIPGGGLGFFPGALGILLACLLWGLDNNFTRHISAKDPRTIVMIKGLVAGFFNLAIWLWNGGAVPAIGEILAAMLLGFFSYGLGIVLFILALRGLGSARTGALYSIAPFVGAALSLIIFREMPGALFLAALPLMITGTALLAWENHEHEHVHDEHVHEHNHDHNDGHHDHAHKENTPKQAGAHCHEHRHATLRHAHAHAPDIHHRHVHGE